MYKNGGLFGIVETDAVIKNVAFTGAKLNALYTGIFAHTFYGTLQNCYINAELTTSAIDANNNKSGCGAIAFKVSNCILKDNIISLNQLTAIDSATISMLAADEPREMSNVIAFGNNANNVVYGDSATRLPYRQKATFIQDLTALTTKATWTNKTLDASAWEITDTGVEFFGRQIVTFS